MHDAIASGSSPRPSGPGSDPAEAARIAAELAARIGRGDPAAESEFVRRHTPGLLAMLRVRCGDEELARDIAQDALQVVLLRLRGPGLEDPTGLGGFLRGTALNLLANALRRGDRSRTESIGERLDALVAESSDPLATVESDDLARAVRRLIGELPVERDRRLLWRHYVMDDPKERLCAEFDLSPEHFDRVLHRARHRLREILAPHVRPRG